MLVEIISFYLLKNDRRDYLKMPIRNERMGLWNI